VHNDSHYEEANFKGAHKEQAHGEPRYKAHQPPVREESSMPPRNPWVSSDMPEAAGKPAWLTQDRSEISSETVSPSALPATPDDTLQGSRDRLTSRWFALRGIFDAAPPPVEPPPAPVITRAPAMAVFSLAGGVGKTSLVATLGRALSARGERVLLVDTAAFGLLPFFFGATDQRPGLLRTFSPPGVSSDAPIQMVTLDPEGIGNDANGQESLSGEILKFSRGASRVIIDLATASGSTTRRILRLSPLVLVPVIPDMNSVVSVSSIDAFFEHNSNPNGKPSLPYYVLNQFDASLPLNLDVREVLREQLAERLLPFALRRAPAISEALAEGMTVMDYAPNSTLAEDFSTLAGWVKSLSAPATTSYRGVRWSER
jgi:cellulose synthase operon protein YhjQ